METAFAAPQAVAYLRGGELAPDLQGNIRFYQVRDSVLVVAEVTGLPENDTGFFALHIHEGTSCGGENFADTGSHFSIVPAEHPRHSGDLPPLLSSRGRAYLVVLTDRFSVRDIINRTVVIHSGADDFQSQPAGNAGMKIACGVIRAV